MRCRTGVAAVLVLLALSIGGAPRPAWAQVNAVGAPTAALPPALRAVVAEVRQSLAAGNPAAAARLLGGSLQSNPSEARQLALAVFSPGLPVTPALVEATVQATVLGLVGAPNAAPLLGSFANGAAQALAPSGAPFVQALTNGAAQAVISTAGGNPQTAAGLIQTATAGAVQGVLSASSSGAIPGGSVPLVEGAVSGALLGAAAGATKTADPSTATGTAETITSAVRTGALNGAGLAGGGPAAGVITQAINAGLDNEQVQGQARTLISTVAPGLTTPQIQTQTQNQTLSQTPVISLPTPPHSSAN
ncbi:MAG: hypothetical protein F8N37_05575 [Telmatospirillum sp.]|nr:hypothetical protein [Telmatospirillum sp.]